MSSQFKQRLLVSSIGILLVALGIYFSNHSLFKPIYVLINAGVISIALIEYYRLTECKGYSPLKWLGTALTIFYVIACYLSLSVPSLTTLPSFVLLGSIILFFLAYFYKHENPLSNLAITAFGISYLTIPLTFGLEINYFSLEGGIGDGRFWLAYLLIVTKITDIGAYLVGSCLGRIKLAPMISPKKTLEGSLGGLATAIGASFLLYSFFVIPGSPQTSLWQSVWLGLLISILSQIGDLAESILKRDAGVKDSNRLPGLGGILDIVDSLVFTLPLMYLLLKAGIVPLSS